MKDFSHLKKVIFGITFDPFAPSLTIETNWWFLLIVIFLTGIYYVFGIKYFDRLRTKWYSGETNIKIKTSFLEYSNKIVRSWENLYIANRIYIELITRKAAIPIDEDNDVVKEIYDSWFTLFIAIRNEIKNLPGDFIKNHRSSNTLIDLTTEILNKGLRPHLTKYQARFRKWYAEQLEDENNVGKSPQEIQREYPEYSNLIESMKEVNETLRLYSIELKRIIDGDNSKSESNNKM